MSAPDPAFLEAVAREAGALLVDRFGSLTGYEKKGRRDLVTAADRDAEALILRRIGARYPEDAILAEESRSDQGMAPRLWIIDPLDGTTNFVHRIPHFAVSIAWYREGRAEVGCVHDPSRDECFTAARGLGAWCNGREIAASGTEALSEAVVATGFHYRREELPDSNLEHFGDVALQVRGVRRFGSAALDLCWVADGRLDGYWEPWLSPWDVAAGALIAQEAGAEVTDWTGGEEWLFGGRIVAGSGALASALRRVLAAADPARLAGPRYQPPGGEAPRSP